MDTVVAGVGFALQAELLPLGQDEASERVTRGSGRIGGAQHLASEVFPRNALPLDNVVVDGGSGVHELGAHGHEESVEHIERALAIPLQLAAIESASELDEVTSLLTGGPHLVKLLRIDLKGLASIHGIQGFSLLQDICPLQAELLLELVLGHGQLVRGENGRLGCNGIVVLVDLLGLVDFFGFKRTFLDNLEALLLEHLLHELLHLVSHRVGLDEEESGIGHHV
mmetsp:Transcript_76382/g.166774  ORF Transcript_76382/g.166774 Transcript_76382/m.166774 type:complete len:225 (-) Transcript_76382:97-771(-)